MGSFTKGTRKLEISGTLENLRFSKGDLVLFPFPYTDLKDRKIRPCLVLSNEMREDLLLCQITSQKIAKDEFCVELKQNQTQQGTLMIDSYIRANMLFTASKKQIQKKLCKINNEQYTKVVEMINKMIK